jgi:class 3 adenylate cyclase/tetratricopeptide (TPR) repeat protein
VLFADLKGSMELLADRDPEEARQILDPVLERMMEAVHRYEGTVNQVMGDGIMALFGAPLAHEDHAVRACYAALRMQESMKRYAEGTRHSHGVEVQIRVGLNSGEVVVGSVGSDLRMDYTAVGQTTHLAARMEQLATPGTIRLTGATLALAEGYIEVKPLGPVPVKGLVDPVEVYEATGASTVRTRLQARARRGLSRFVGRDAELGQLRRAQQQAGDGHGQVAAIVGEAGVGKSRLVHEFIHSHRLAGWRLLESASVSYGKATSYLPVIDLLKGYFKIQDRDDLREIREKVTGKLLTLDRALEPTLPALLALLDVPVDDGTWQALDPPTRRQRTIDDAKRVLLREARAQPLLLVLEDLHWIDDETQALLDGLVDGLGSARLMLLVNYRPEYRHAWASKTCYSQVRLDPLPPESTTELLESLLGEDASLVPLKQLLVKRGNPFFLEETVQTLVETKALAGERGRYRLVRALPSLQVPPTVQAMLAARMDRLPAEDKRLLQVASVIGKDVPFALLLAVAELPNEALRAALGRLQEAEFMYETGMFPDLEYSFKHALTHEVAYGGLLQERRRELHARIVDAIERLHRERLGEQIERLAHHAVRGDLRERAVEYLRQAGRKAATRSATAAARDWFEQAIPILDALPESRATLEQAFDVRLELRQVLNVLGEGQEMSLRTLEAEALAERVDDDGRRARVWAFLTTVHARLGELDEALDKGVRAVEIAERLGDLHLLIPATSCLAQVLYHRADHERVAALVSSSLARFPDDLVQEDFGMPVQASILLRYWLVMSLAELGRFAEASRHAADAIQMAEARQHAPSMLAAHGPAGTLQFLKGDVTRESAPFERQIAISRTGQPSMVGHTVAHSALELALRGEASLALDRILEGEQLLEEQERRGAILPTGQAFHSLGRACLLLGRLDQARALAARARETSSRYPGWAAHAEHLLGDIAAHPDDFDARRGETHYRQALALAEPRGMRPLVAHCHLGLGKLYRRTGKRQEAQEHLANATTMYREMEMTYWLEQAEAELKEYT